MAVLLLLLVLVLPVLDMAAPGLGLVVLKEGAVEKACIAVVVNVETRATVAARNSRLHPCLSGCLRCCCCCSCCSILLVSIEFFFGNGLDAVPYRTN